MKQFKVVALSSKNNLLVLDPQGQSYEFPLQGFKVLPSLHSRPLLEDLIGKNIQCTLNKNATHIRYQNEAFFTEKIQAGVIEVVPKELQETRIYNVEQKARLSKCQKKADQKQLEIVDVVTNRKEILKIFCRGGEIKGNIEWLGQEIIISTFIESKLAFLPLRLRNINTLFECLPESLFVSFVQQYSKITVNLQRPIYNLIKKRFELIGSLSNQIEIRLLSEGWATINSAALAKIGGTDYSAYLKAQNEAKAAHKGVFSRNCEILAFIYAKNNFVGEISDVIDGYIFEVTKKAGGGKIKLQLAMVRCPVGDQPGAFNCRQFSRKQLIGQQVNVYLHKDSGLNITGSLIRAKDTKDVEAMLVQQGWAFVRQEFINSVLCIKLNELERRSKQKMRGLFSKDLGIHRPQDLTQPNTHKEDIYYDRRNHILKSANDNQNGVLEGIVDVLTYKIWLQDKNALLKIKLQGIQGHNINPLLQEVKKMKEDHKQLYETKLKKRSIQVTITSYNKDLNIFIGTITFTGGKTLQQVLLQQSLVYSEREGNAPQNYRAIEKKVRDGGKGLWSPNLINFQPIDALELQNQKFNGKFSWVQDGQSVYIQPQTNYKTLDMIASKLRQKQLKKASKQQIVNGSLVVAPYFQDFYRALIISVKAKKIKVIFIDWGNKQTVEQGDLRELPEELKFIEKQSIKAKLYLTKPIKNEQYLQRVRGELMDGNEYNFKKEANGYVQAYRNKQNIVLSLIERGIVKGNTEQATPSLKTKILALEENLKNDKIGVWEESEEEEMSDNSEND